MYCKTCNAIDPPHAPGCKSEAANIVYEVALRRIDDLMDAQPGTPEIEELEKIVSWVDAHETAMGWP